VEGEKGITQRQYKWRLQSLLILSNVGTLSKQPEEEIEES